ncbi:hypothetical protein PM082_007566 [Marasmius tenuissimus]|nr:hypothetical protein PM082_007566 [Marasmius tenuissimus]
MFFHLPLSSLSYPLVDNARSWVNIKKTDCWADSPPLDPVGLTTMLAAMGSSHR